MLKSLVKLRCIKSSFYASDYRDLDDFAGKLADEIQAEIGRYYLPRPLFEDGEPVHVGDRAEVDGVVGSVQYVGYADNGWRVFIEDKLSKNRAVHIQDIDGNRVKRPSEPDTQERIDADAMMQSADYCRKYGITWDVTQGNGCRQLMNKHLLQRQRDLCARGDA